MRNSGSGDPLRNEDELGSSVPPDSGGAVEVMRSEEELQVWFDRVPTTRLRAVKYIVTEEVVRTIQVSHEEIHFEEEPVRDAAPLDRWAARHDSDNAVDIVLHDEEIVVERRIVPRERVRIWVEDVSNGERVVRERLRSEQVEITGVDDARS